MEKPETTSKVFSLKEIPGPVKRNPMKCKICNVEVSNENEYIAHISTPEHKMVYAALENDGIIDKKCGIYVRGYGPEATKEGLVKYFSKFGCIVWIRWGVNFTLLDYSDSSSAETMMKRDHYLEGKRLYVKYRESRPVDPKVSKEKEEEHGDFLRGLACIDSFNEQCRILTTHLQGDWPLLFQKYNQICNDLWLVISPFYPQCQIHPFGSTITGLGFTDSDLDAYISGVKSGYSEDVPCLYKIKSVLLSSQKFLNPFVIARAKIPILKCVHRETNVSCDINLRNMLGVFNSKLVSLYSNANHKIKMMLIILKYWAKTRKLTGRNHLFTNYSLNLMAIYFLQQPPYRAPAVLSLQRHYIFHNFQDHYWNGGFEERQVYIPSLERTSVINLLMQFFTFYANFPYTTHIICPYLGEAIKKEEFLLPELLPAYFGSYKIYVKLKENQPLRSNTSICIQDPFEHCRNTTSAVSDSILQMFVILCHLGKKLCEDGPKGLLHKLCTEEDPVHKPTLNTDSDTGFFSLALGVNLKYLESKLDGGKANQAQELHNECFRTVQEFLVIVLRDFLKFEVEEKAEPVLHKNVKSEDQTDVHDNKHVVYKCTAKLNFWQDRNVTLKDSEPTSAATSVVNKEKAITSALCKKWENLRPTANIIETEISMAFRNDPPKIDVKLKKISCYKKLFKSFSHTFPIRFKKWLETYIEDLNAKSPVC